MEIQDILKTLDELFTSKQLHTIEPFLMNELTRALSLEEHEIAITLMNELIGYYRSVSRTDDAILITDKALFLLEHMGLLNTLPHATTLLNGATAYRSGKHYASAETMYHSALALYEQLLPRNDIRFASLYNNMSLCFSEQQRYEQGISYLLLSLEILEFLEHSSASLLVETAITHTNISSLYFEQEELSSSKQHLKQALTQFDQLNATTDAHYSGALSLLAGIHQKEKNYEEAISLYEHSLCHIKEHFGETYSYAVVCENFASLWDEIHDLNKSNFYREYAYAIYVKIGVKERPLLSGMELSKRYYETYGKPMLQEKFPDFVDRIAVGLVGHGSECYGFDDELSRDHDFGPGFCMWLTKEDYDLIGVELSHAYDSLPSCFLGYEARVVSARGENRVGVFQIDCFYEELLGGSTFEESALSTATNGEIFVDSFGEFSKIRSHLQSYYCDSLWRKKLAQELALMAQSGQYNYPRCMKRQDVVAAQLALQQFITSTMTVVHILNKTYTPYYKWMYQSMLSFSLGQKIGPLITSLCMLGDQSGEPKDEKFMLIEKICTLLLEELEEQQFIHKTSDFLEDYVDALIQ